MANRKVLVQPLNEEFVFVDRKQLRCAPGTKQLSLPDPAIIEDPEKPFPKPPATVDYTGTAPMPTLGNNRVGDCFYTACAHQVIAWAASNGVEVTFDEAQLVARYLVLSRGDHGLDWRTMMQEFKSGIVGPNGPYKQIGLAVVDPNNRELMQLALYLFGPLMFTLATPDVWIQQHTRPNGTWDAVGGARPNQRNGHAIILSGYNDRGYQIETWGVSPQITLTYRGMSVCDPEAAALMSPLWFLPDHLTPAGHAWSDVRDYWVQMGGSPLPETPPFPTPEPGPEPGPGPQPGPEEGTHVDVEGEVAGSSVKLHACIYTRGEHGQSGQSIGQRMLAGRPAQYSPEQWQRIVNLFLQLLGVLMQWDTPPVTAQD